MSSGCIFSVVVLQLKFLFHISVDHRQLRPELRAEQDPDGDVGHLRRAAPHVRRPEDAQAGLQGHPAEQEDHPGQPGHSRHPGTQDLQGE